MRIRILAWVTIALMTGLAACKKNNDAPVVTPTVGLNIVNASTNTINIYLNGSRLIPTSSILPGYATGYKAVPEGQQSYQIKKPFDINTNTIQELFSITLPADTDEYRTLYVTDETAEDAFSTVDIFKPLYSSQTDTCYIRFVNTSPGAGNLDMVLGNNTPISNVPFAKGSAFEYADVTNGVSVSGLIAIKVYNSGSATPLLTDNVSLYAGNYYTVYTLGKPGDAGFNIGIAQN